MKVLITGSNGQLGSEIKELVSEFENLECIFKDLPELDICDIDMLTTIIIRSTYQCSHKLCGLYFG
jgi:dTDP-4-dehydrorhamnose reductase